MINRDSLKLTRGFDLKRHYGIKRHDRLNAPDDKVDVGTTTCRPRNYAGATACRRQASTTRSTIEKSPPIKINFKEFSGELEDWTKWSKVHRAQLSARGCAAALTETADDETKANHDDFDRDSADPDQLHKEVSLVTSCKEVAFDIVNAEESASEAWAKLVQHYQASGLKER